MTPEEAARLLQATEDGEKPLLFFLNQPPKKDKPEKDW